MPSKENGEIIVNWKKIVIDEYKKINKKNEQLAKKLWNQNRADMIELNKTDQCEWDKGSVTWEPKIKINGSVLTHLIPLPPMQMWTPTQQNVMVDDETELVNIPFMVEEDQSFIEELLEEYKNGVDVGDENDDYLLDTAFIELVNAMIPYQNVGTSDEVLGLSIDATGGNNTSPMIGKKTFPCDDIFKVISYKFPNKGTADELRKRYIELAKLNDENRPLNASSNADGPNTEEMPSEQLINLYRSLLCRRCFKYDCQLHRKDKSQEAKPSTNSSKKLKPFSEPCSPWCYMHMASSLEPQPGTSKDDNCNDVNYTMNAEWSNDWSDSDLTLFRSLYEVFPKNYCVVAQAMLTKTCQQVYEFCEKELLNLSVESSSDASKQSRKKFKVLRTNGQSNKSGSFALRKKSDSKDLHNYSPCAHDGPCTTDSCSCFRAGNYCEKFCNCSNDCSRRFSGCKCSGKCKSKACPCAVASRECDPDLCTNCGADKIFELDVNCENVCIQRKQHKHLLMAPSDIAGWGIFIREGAKKGDFIAEYCGEIISQDEANRRGKLYDKFKCSFLFELNAEYVVDATRIGNKMRFANHSRNPNCYVQVKMVNGDHRIGFFAKRDILPGEELFFDYRYGPNEALKFVGIEGRVEFT